MLHLNNRKEMRSGVKHVSKKQKSSEERKRMTFYSSRKMWPNTPFSDVWLLFWLYFITKGIDHSFCHVWNFSHTIKKQGGFTQGLLAPTPHSSRMSRKSLTEVLKFCVQILLMMYWERRDEKRDSMLSSLSYSSFDSCLSIPISKWYYKFNAEKEK